MKTLIIAVALFAAGPALAQTSSGQSAPPVSDLTRMLNGSAPAVTAPAPARTVPTPTVTQPAPVAAPVPTATAATPAAVRAAAPAVAAVAPPAVAEPPAAPAEGADSAPSAPAATVLDGAAIAALPFTVTVPDGFQITTGRPGPDFMIYTIRRGDEPFAMVYVGSASQFPIYDGQMISAGGRSSIVVTENGQRHAMEHLFQRATAPHEIHIWVSSVPDADRGVAEQIAQSVDVR